jgi:hypothetical protein
MPRQSKNQEDYIMDLLLAGAAIWLSLGAIKGIIWIQQIPEFMGWWVFYRSRQDAEQASEWHKKVKWVLFAVCLGMLTFVMFSIFGPLVLPRERMRYFGPYGSAYVAGIAARHNNIDCGVEPLEFESWDDYTERRGDDPRAVANAIQKIPFDKLPEKVQDVIKVAESLRDIQDRNVPEVDEDEEFRSDDDEQK